MRAGETTGFLEEARYQALETDKRDPSWDAKWLYHGFGGAAKFIPVVGDATQRGVDALVYRWQLEEQRRIDDENQQQNGKVFTRGSSSSRIWPVSGRRSTRPTGRMPTP